MGISLRRRSPRAGATGRAMAVIVGAAALLLAAPGLTPSAHGQTICFDGNGDVVPCDTEPPPTVPPTAPPPTLPPPTSPPQTSPPPPPPTSPPPATIAPQTVPDRPTPNTSRSTVTTDPPATNGVTAAPTTSTTKPRKAKPKPTTTVEPTTTTEARRLVASPLSRVGPPPNDGGSFPMKTIAAIFAVALLLVLGILGPELRDRFGRRPSAV